LDYRLTFRIFKERIENIANRKIKNFRTDGGTEYKGAFSDFVLTQGIIKQTGSSNRKHLPARAERAHRTVLELARACHTGSKLPLSYYTDAHRYAVYTLNRLIRDGKQKSPFEIITGRVVELLREHDHKIVYSPDVVFLEDEIMEPLNGTPEEKYDELYESKTILK